MHSELPRTAEYHVIVVGSGLSGICMLHQFQSRGLKALVVEAADAIGGTWYYNCYPGARCDVESYLYSYSFSPDVDQEWTWTERYASQPEILRYIEYVVDKFALRPHIRLRTKIVQAKYLDSTSTWLLTSSDGATFTAQYCVMATGCLSIPSNVDIEGISEFSGDVYRTSRWPHTDVDFTGKRVGIIGTGSSAVQTIPYLAAQAHHLYVYQRTPNYCIPSHNRSLTPSENAAIKSVYTALREQSRRAKIGIGASEPTPHLCALEVDDAEREGQYLEAWLKGDVFSLPLSYLDLLVDEKANATVSNFVRDRIAAAVQNPIDAERLKPRSYGLGTRRICLENGYYESFNRPNVSLVDLTSTPLLNVTSSGITTTSGHYDLDVIVLATGFDAMTGALLSIDIYGSGGRPLKECWSAAPDTYLGVAIPDFPNLFLITGPGSPTFTGNMTVSIEQHVQFIADAIDYVDRRGAKSIAASSTATLNWMETCRELVAHTLLPDAPSWWNGWNTPGKPRVFMAYFGGLDQYRRICEQTVQNGFQGFTVE